ncbi:Rv3654c family TadE-like protein [Pedococcus sp. KACC 23699]|uniref:Rv3654c family TadE-like protein n=1 Tax=Pedococcus sp. KACC 23699 TaxID=3149228 RepID=A0AAU7JPB6_9MICO
MTTGMGRELVNTTAEPEVVAYVGRRRTARTAVSRAATRLTGRPMSCRCRRDEQGSGTVLALAATAVLVMILVAGLALASAVAAAHRARAGADLGALAAAAALQGGGSSAEACARAATVAAANTTEQQSCFVGIDGSVRVTTTALVGLVLPGLGAPRARATARAGPAPLL